jgi:2',3'-cyclic-nucleotide 2'-phosphodiesterase (5'-nucleotidase family)
MQGGWVGTAMAALLAATACGGDDSTTATGGAGATGGTGGTGGLGGTGGTGGTGGSAGGEVVTVTIFHTGDEHGHLQPDSITKPVVVQGGAANFRAWLGDAGYDPDQHLLLSAGDNWGGGAVISTFSQGEPVVEVFNMLGYDAAVIGNHEFDFEVPVLLDRIAQADYPHLSANIVDDATGELAAFAQPYVILPSNGIDVGVVGLTTQSTPTSGHPKFVQGLSFTDSVAALQAQIPQMRDDGADIIVVLAHECGFGLTGAVAAVADDVDLALGGHCHTIESEEVAGVPVILSGEHFGTFSRIDLTFDTVAASVTEVSVDQQNVRYLFNQPNPVTPDPAIAAYVDGWQQQVDAALSEPVGHSNSGIVKGGWPMANWIVDAWLASYPQADLAMTNFGAMRAALPAGDFTLAELFDILPFQNDLVLVDLKGSEVQQLVAFGASGGAVAVGGMTYLDQGGTVTVTVMSTGQPIEPDGDYTVIVPDFVYWGGGGYDFMGFNPNGTELGVHFRDPVKTWTQQLLTSMVDPLENYIDPVPRNQ